MRVLVVGSGGREHALCWALAKEAEVFCAPGNPGIVADATVVPIPAIDHNALTGFAIEKEIDLVVVGPENPLIAGLADDFRGAGVRVFGVGAEAAMLEGSKVFSKDLMSEAGVRTARYKSFDSAEPAKLFAAELCEGAAGVVVKASGLALGKGAVVCDNLADAEKVIDDMLVRNFFGDAGKSIVVEQRLCGPEFSLLTLVSGKRFRSLPIAQDYKAAYDGGKGPNTGGMGSYSPVHSVSESLVQQTEREIVEPLLTVLAERNIDFRGVLFSGLLIDGGLPYCLEYNVRFGDPETQSVVSRLGAGFCDALLAVAKGEEIPPIEVLPNAAVSVVVASRGYPDTPEKGYPISLPAQNGAKIFHAGTAMKDGQLVNSGGRVFAVTGVGQSIAEARSKAYDAAGQIEFEGAWFRSDIAELAPS